MNSDADLSLVTDKMTLDQAWDLVGEACYAFENQQARHALMLIRGDVGAKNHLLGMLRWQLLGRPDNG